MQFVLGGNRVGSGKKMRGSMSNYNRSTHNLSEKWTSSMASGILYPAMCKLAMRGDAFDITIDADCRTIPTQGPLFGTYKMQVDVYQVPIRLYQALLHNNPLAIGMKMSQVCFPQLLIKGQYAAGEKGVEFNNSCLLKYLGMSGLGATTKEEEEIEHRRFERGINAIPALAYYDIFKTYYANKQEDKAYVISGKSETTSIKIEKIGYSSDGFVQSEFPYGYTNWANITLEVPQDEITLLMPLNISSADGAHAHMVIETNLPKGQLTDDEVKDRMKNARLSNKLIEDLIDENAITNVNVSYVNNKMRYTIDFDNDVMINTSEITRITKIDTTDVTQEKTEKLQLIPFDLSTIDDMRYDLLSYHQLGTPFIIKNNEDAYLPYKTLVDTYTDVVNDNDIERTKNALPLNGLVLKTYQNDIFNNWLNTEWIEGENGISALTKVQTDENGRFSMDALNFAEKLYTMLNRVVVTDGTYESWQDTMYEEVKRRQIESPIFCGGISQEVVFDEIVQTAPAGDGVLGTLGGRGRLKQGSKKGGKLHIKCDEACFIIGIVSLTPRQNVTQGNEFYMTDVMTMDDIHKPAMDGIGFQDLIGERLAWWDTKYKEFGGQYSLLQHRSKIGKLPAWIEYMTSVDRAYGDFAKIPDGETSVNKGAGYMILNRNYEYDEETGGIKDATTYVDPQKYNYAFAYKALDAQNFWVQIKFGIKARRLMSARLMPSV